MDQAFGTESPIGGSYSSHKFYLSHLAYSAARQCYRSRTTVTVFRQSRRNIPSGIFVEETDWLQHESYVTDWHHRPIFESWDVMRVHGVPEHDVLIF